MQQTAPASPADLAVLEQQASQSSDAQTGVRLAQAYRAADRRADAKPVLERVLVRHPGEPQATLLLGITYEELGLYGDARRLYRSYIDHGPSAKMRAELTRRLPVLQRRELQVEVRKTVAREAELANTPPQPFSVAVFPFKFLGADPQYLPLGRALAEMLVTDLSQTNRLKVLERVQVQLLLDEMKLAQTGAVDVATAARTGRMLGAERVVSGSMDGGQSSMQLETTIVRVGSSLWPGEAASAAERPNLLALSESDALTALVAMQKRLALRIYASLGVELTPAERERVTRRATENLMAVLAYGRGLEAEDAGDLAAAARAFSESAALDPGFTQARVSAERATASAAAASIDTRQLASSVEVAAAPTSTNESFLPDPLGRDQVAEILRTEGTGGTALELIIRRP